MISLRENKYNFSQHLHFLKVHENSSIDVRKAKLHRLSSVSRPSSRDMNGVSHSEL